MSNRPPSQPEVAKRLAWLESVFENAVDAIITIDQHGVIHAVNAAAVRQFAYRADEMLGQNIKLLMPEPYRSEHDEYLRRYFATGERKIIGIGREVTGRRKDGVTFPMHLAVSEITVEGQRMFVGMVRDISDLKAVEAELERLNAHLEQRVQERTRQLRAAQGELLRQERLVTLGQVSGGIAHEIRNPLNAVKTSTYYLLHAKQLPRDKMIEHLERIDRQVTLIDQVVTALADVARMPEPKLGPVQLAPLLREVLRSVTLPATINVSLEISDTFPVAWADQHQLPIVFRNLVRNARDAMPEGGSLTITGREDATDTVEVVITDTGEGMSEESQRRATEPLYSTKARGMGLGLAISRTILEKNRGSLAIASEVGRGSEFSVRLPRAAEEP